MAGPLIMAAVFACIIGCSLYFRAFPAEMSESGLKRLRNGLLFTAFSLLLLSAICEIIFFAGNWGFVAHRGFLFWLIFAELIVNGVAVFSLLRPLINLLPFSSGDASDISYLGMTFGFALGLIEALLCLYGFGLTFI
jgi:hypothetical protein